MYNIIFGDSLEKLKCLDDNSIDSVVTDPPSGIGFMNLKWDTFNSGMQSFQDFMCDVFINVHRVLKPGGHGLVWSLPRTSHHVGMGLERAGFEIRDCIYHCFGNGYPKSYDISKGIDKKKGTYVRGVKSPNSRDSGISPSGCYQKSVQVKYMHEPQHELAKEWDGWGTGLKPSIEVWWLIRKPLEKSTIVDNVLTHGTGGININDARIIIENDINKKRYPSQLIIDDSEDVLNLFPHTKSGVMNQDIQGRQCNVYGKQYPRHVETIGDEGSAARFFYCAKASPSEKTFNKAIVNNHPTVKPLTLMRYLCKLITPKNGVILDPFMGSGTTGIAAILDGFQFIGIEKNQDFFDIASARLEKYAFECKKPRAKKTQNKPLF